MRRFLRPMATATLVAVLAAACGSGGTSPVAEGIGPGVAIAATPSTSSTVPSTTTTAAPPTTTTVDPATTTTTVRPPAPHETFVAHVLPEVTEIVAFTEPGGTEIVPFEFRITNPTYWGNPLTLMVLDRTPDGEWLRVQIPVRPNGTEGWIPAAQAEIRSHFIRAQVDLTARSVTVWDGDDVIAETGAVIGADRSPTPVGSFFVNDLVEKWDGSAFGPYILSLSAFSEALETFAGGIPVIAIHGTNRPELVGGAHSNGCIRVPNDVITFLAENVPMGTPVDIVA
ncbi:MAG: L,D-transpeptidase [Actinomycetota bacterium]